MAERRNESRFWLWYFALFLFAIGLSWGYATWRESSLEPVTIPIDIRRPGTYQVRVGAARFHPSDYHPGFHIVLATPTDEHWWDGARTPKIWNGTPPLVDVVIRDSAGAIVLKETGLVSESNGWSVTGRLGSGETDFDLYKLNQFRASPFRSYTITMRVVRGSPTAAVASAEFFVSTIKAYALLGSVLLFVFLVGLMVFGIPVALLCRGLLARRDRTRSA